MTAYGATKYEGAGFAASSCKRLERIIGTSVCEDNKNNNAKNAKCSVY